jgi:hypothetical protein
VAADDDDDGVHPTVMEANEELRRVAVERAHEHFERAEKRAAELVARLEALSHEVVLMATELNNWIGLLRELKQKEQA